MAHFSHSLSVSFRWRKNPETIQECAFRPENQTAGKVSRRDINETFIKQVEDSQMPLDCLWTIEVKPNWQVRAIFQFYILLLLVLWMLLFLSFHNFISILRVEVDRVPFNDHTYPSNQTITSLSLSLFFISPFTICLVRYVLFFNSVIFFSFSLSFFRFTFSFS